MALLYTRRRLDVDGFYHRHPDLYNDAGYLRLITWDRLTGTTAGAIQTTDGFDWVTLFSASSAQIGGLSDYDGKSIIRYGDSLFFTLYRLTTDPKVLEYKSDGTFVNHLASPLQDNYLAYGLYKCFGKMWVITDVTPFVGGNSRRVIYYWDGIGWTAIVSYVGAGAYLDYGTATDVPDVTVRHRCTKLLFYDGSLYLFAARYNGAWGMEIWKYDAGHFDLIYSIYDGFYFCGVIECDGKLYITRSRMFGGKGRNETNTYEMTDLATFTRVHPPYRWYDSFADGIRDPLWADAPHSGIIVEAADVCTYSVAGGVNGDWWTGLDNAPVSVMVPDSKDDIVVVCRLNNFTVNNRVAAGLYISDVVEGASGYQFSRFRNDTTVQNGLRVTQQGIGNIAYVAVTTLPIYLRMRISGSGVGHSIKFDYSADQITWTRLATVNDYAWNYVGLFAQNWGTYLAVAAPFEFFYYFRPHRFPTGECVFGGELRQNTYYDNGCVTDPKYMTQAAYTFDREVSEYVLDAVFSDNLISGQCGGMANFTSAKFIMAGKWREIWGASAGAMLAGGAQMRRKKRSMVVLEMDYKDRLGNIYTKRIAPIDARAPLRFYEGRLLSLSSLTRAIDDRTGLYRPADMNASLVNSDREFSKLLTRYIFKNQQVRVYHLWCEEPEALRKHVITMITEDHTLKGPEFRIKTKDRLQQYFAQSLPSQICTTADWPNIHPSHVGKAVPEVLGFNEVDATYQKPGAVEAVYVDTVAFRYLCANGILPAVTQVYSKGVLQVTPGDYSIVYIGGRTLIDFVADQGTNSVTFNGRGYSWGPWDSPSGHVQNPAYIVEYFLRFLVGIPAALIDQDWFDATAMIFDAMGAGESGKLAMQGETAEVAEWLRQLLFSMGAKLFPALDGKIRIGRKDIYNFQPSELIFDQIDLIESNERPFNLTEAVNTAKARWDYVPWQRLWKGATEEYRENFFDAVMEDDIKIPERPPEMV